jgi:hypothetical protein
VFTHQFSQALKLCRGALGSGWVVQVVEDQEPCLGGDLTLEPLKVEMKTVVALSVGVGHSNAAKELDQRAVNGKAGVGVEDLIAGVHKSEQKLGDNRLATWLHAYVLATVGETAGRAHVGRQRITQRRDAGIRAVRGLAGADRLERGSDDMLRGGDVEIAEVKRIDRLALCRQRGRFFRDRKNGLGTKMANALSGDEIGGQALPVHERPS